MADHYPGSYFNDQNDESLRQQERDHERYRIEQRFMGMNRQIGELTSMVTITISRHQQFVHRFILYKVHLHSYHKRFNYSSVGAESMNVITDAKVLLKGLTTTEVTSR